MKKLPKLEIYTFKKIKSGVEWKFRGSEYFDFQVILTGYILKGVNQYLKEPLLFAVLKQLLSKKFNSLIAPQNIKLTEPEAIAILSILEREGEFFLKNELSNILKL